MNFIQLINLSETRIVNPMATRDIQTDLATDISTVKFIGGSSCKMTGQGSHDYCNQLANSPVFITFEDSKEKWLVNLSLVADVTYHAPGKGSSNIRFSDGGRITFPSDALGQKMFLAIEARKQEYELQMQHMMNQIGQQRQPAPDGMQRMESGIIIPR